MIGRDQERERLSAILSGARNGERQLVLVTGEAGLGKSRLVDDAAADAIGASFEVLAGECHPGDRGVPLAPFVDAIRQRIGGSSAADARAFLGSACPTLAGFVPEIAAICTPGMVVGLEPQQAKSMVFEAIAGILVRRAIAHPVLLILEDMQWADPTSFDLLAILARRTFGHPIALVVTIRTEDREPGFDSSPAALRRIPDAQEIRLRPLDGPSTAQLVASVLAAPPSAAIVVEIERRSGGNPLFIQELAAAPRSADTFLTSEAGAVPPDLAGLVLRRVDELSVEHRVILELASVSGQHISESFVAEAGGWSTDLVSDAFASGQRAGIVESSGERPAPGTRAWRFHHELTREAMYEGLAPSRRRKLHGQVAAAMLRDDVGHETARVAPATLGWHLHAAGDWPLALEHCRIAADLARRIHATREAVVSARRALDAALALDHPAVGRLHLECGQDLALLGDEVAAEAHFRDAERRSAGPGGLEIRQAAVEGLAGLAASRDYAAAEHLAREAVRLAEELGDEQTIARSLNRLGNILMNGLRFSEGRAMHEDALARLARLDDPWGVADALDHIAMSHYLSGDVRNARDVFGQAAASFEALGDSGRSASALTSRGLYLAVLDGACETDIGPDEYRADAERGLVLARTIGWRAGEAYALAALACAALGAGEIAIARARTAEAAAVAGSIEHRQWTLLAEFIGGLIDVALRDETAASVRFGAALSLAESTRSAQWTDRLSAWVDRGRALQGNASSLDRLADRAGPADLAVGRIGQGRARVALMESAVLAHGGAARMTSLGSLATDLSGAAEVQFLRGEECRLRGLIAEADGYLRQAEAAARSVGPRPLIWRIAAARARSWQGLDRDEYRRAIDIARQELDILAASADEADRSSLLRSAEARAVPGPGRRGAAASPATLSRREHQVAEGVARGLRNKEIGAELGITTKTVEMHVANAIAKTGVSSRSSLAVWVTTEAPGDP